MVDKAYNPRDPDYYKISKQGYGTTGYYDGYSASASSGTERREYQHVSSKPCGIGKERMNPEFREKYLERTRMEEEYDD